MKKVLFTLAFAICLLGAVSAQVTLRPYIGINSSTLSEDLIKDTASFASNVGYQLGADLQIGNKFYVQPGLQFEFLSNPIDPQGGDEEEFKRTYMRIPVMVGYNFADAESTFGLRVFTGPNFGFNLGTNSDLEDVDDYVKNTIFGWNAGLGLDLISILFVDLGYQFGLSEVFEDIDSSARNNLFYANAGLRVRF